MAKIRVLLADNYPAVLARVCRILDDDFEIVGTVNNGQEAVEEAIRLDPDILVSDSAMPVLNGLQAADYLSTASRRTKIVFLTVSTDTAFVSAAFSAGAYGYVAKSDLTFALVPAIREALAGRRYISRSIGA